MRLRCFPLSCVPVRRLAVCVSIAVAAACAESSLVPPTAPSPLSPHKIGVLGLDCPVGPGMQSPDGRPIPIHYPPPTVRGGEAPVAVTCDPASGTRFPVGGTRVTCTARDGLGQEAACSFVVQVQPPPTLGATRILAFGDSLTAGVLLRAVASPEHSYPGQLARRLRSAYPTQTIHVFNEGLPGERAAEAPPRLRAALAQHRPEVVLLMEGTNDLALAAGAGADAALEALDRMLQLTREAGAAPVLATVPPVRASMAPAHAASVPDFNRRVRSLAAAQGVALVDVQRIITRGRCSTASGGSLPCLGPDGIHPTVEGYGLMADAFFDLIVRRYDDPAAAQAGPSALVPAAPAPVAAVRAGGGPRED